MAMVVSIVRSALVVRDGTWCVVVAAGIVTRLFARSGD